MLENFFDWFLKKYRSKAQLCVLLPIYLSLLLSMGISLFPAFFLECAAYRMTENYPWPLQALSMALAFPFAIVCYAMTSIFILPITNYFLAGKLTPIKVPYFSGISVRWFTHNAITYVARYTFLELFTPSPLSNFFYRKMGMKIGKNVHINTTNISDPSLITIEDHVTIGGSAYIVGHYGSGGQLTLARITIKKNATIGLKATLLGDVEIGENSVVLANSFVKPRTIIPPNEIWGGVPAQKIKDVKQT